MGDKAGTGLSTSSQKVQKFLAKSALNTFFYPQEIKK
jgi:hypothetical protein